MDRRSSKYIPLLTARLGDLMILAWMKVCQVRSRTAGRSIRQHHIWLVVCHLLRTDGTATSSTDREYVRVSTSSSMTLMGLPIPCRLQNPTCRYCIDSEICLRSQRFESSWIARMERSTNIPYMRSSHSGGDSEAPLPYQVYRMHFS